MSDQKFQKITYHVGTADKAKINSYLKMPSPVYAVLLREIEMCIFDQHQQPRTEIRTYWIDEDGDEIEVVNQCDYEIFMSKRGERRHLQVAPRRAPAAVSQNSTSPKDATDSSKNAHSKLKSVHPRVECDGCQVSPIVGFRYKCIQCANFDLCENCERNHVHPEHMMVRMPNANSPDVIETYITGRGSSRRHHKFSANAAGTCPFAEMLSPGVSSARTPKTSSGGGGGGEANGSKPPGGDGSGGKDHHHGRHGRKHQRRHMQNNIFTHLYNMMQDLAEGGGPSLNEDLDNDIKKAAAAAAAEAATQAATAAAATASAAATAATQAATQAAFNITTNPTAPEEPKNTGTKPKMSTPPSTPNVATTKEPEFKQTQQSTNDTASASFTSQAKENTANDKTTPTTPILNSPIFENVSQYVDPQYMKAGIQILNNFSEMFAKMLDGENGVDGVGGGQNQFGGQQRKNSTNSTSSMNISSSSSSSTTTSSMTNNQTQTPTTPKQTAAEATAQSLDAEGAVGGVNIANDSIKTNASELNSAEQTRERRRSQSDDTEWQIIDEQPSVGTPIESLIDITPPAAETPKTPIKAPNVQTINYVQLSKDLQAHIDQEKEKEAQKEKEKEEAAKLASATAQASAMPTQRPPTPIYHRNPHINSSVIALLEMGFSNENNNLAQLCETVNGNIDTALEMLGVIHK